MTQQSPFTKRSTLNRRAALALGAAGLATLAFPRAGFAQAAGWQRSEEALAILDGAEPITQGVNLSLPMVSENGASVSLGVVVDRPMAEGERVASIHVIAPANPYPEIAAYHLSELSGPPNLETRIRLNESQTVIVLAKLTSGAVLVGEQAVRVTTSGCLTQAETYDADNLFNTRVRAPGPLRAGEAGEVLTIINHPMETGLRTDGDGNTIPKRLIERFEASLDGHSVLVADLHRSVAANPYLKFGIAPVSGGILEMAWTEDTGEVTRTSAEIAIAG